MELFTGDLKVIEEECDILRNQLFRAKNKTERLACISTLDMLNELYLGVSGFENKKSIQYRKNEQWYHEAMTKQRIQSNQFVDNFIYNKEFYAQIIRDILDMMNELVDEFFIKEEGIALSDLEMYEIMMKYLCTKGMDQYLTDVIHGKRIFSVKSIDDNTTGSMIFNTVHAIAHILIDTSTTSADIMTAIIHEIGHSYDLDQLCHQSDFKTMNNYYMKSIYIEVISHQFEKDFLDYLLNQDIYLKDTCNAVGDYYFNTLFNLQGLFLLTQLDNKLLRGEQYKFLSNVQIVNEASDNHPDLEMDEAMVDIIQIDLFLNLVYGCGGILSTYFNHLKKVDPEKYDFSYHNFLLTRADDFNVNNFNSFLENKEDLVNFVVSEMKEDLKIQQKVYMKMDSSSNRS